MSETLTRVTKNVLIDAYRNRLVMTYDWAADKQKLKQFVDRFSLTAYGQRLTLLDSPVLQQVWADLGLKGKPTYRALHALPH